MRSMTFVALVASTGLTLGTTAGEAAGDDAAPASSKTSSAAAAGPEASQGLVPLPDYSGSLLERSRLTGDWGGARSDLASKGVQFDVGFTQHVQGVTQGGNDTDARYGGSLDYLLHVDLDRMGVARGALITLRAESRYGRAANDLSGSLLPVNTDGLFPLTERLDDDIALTVTTLRYAQFLSDRFGVVVGKFDTLDSPNEFAGGRGVSQFMNGNFVMPSTGALTVPYTTLGTGVVVMPIKNLTLTSLIVNTSDSSTTSGFGDIGEGWTCLNTLAYHYRVFELPGGADLAGAYAADRSFNQVSGGLVFEPGQGLTTVKVDNSWFFTADAWQYIWLKEPAPEKPVDVTNGQQDLQGIGLFVRIGFADKDTNPIEYALTGGIAAKGLIPTRDRDTVGLAYAYNRIQKTRLGNLLGVDDHNQAFEAYYNIALTPATHLTLDLQVVDPAQSRIDTAVVLGARLDLRF